MYRELKYILDENRNPVPCPDQIKFGKWMKDFNNNCRISLTRISNQINTYEVSTVFLGFDHAITGPPVLFETMVFGSEGHEEPIEPTQTRYTTYEGAKKGHQIIVNEVLRQLNGN